MVIGKRLASWQSWLGKERGLDPRTEQLRTRTKEFAIRIIQLFRSLPPAKEAQIIGSQLLRCGTSVGANYRAACHARSRADFISKIGIVTEEADETVFWIELLADLGITKKEKLESLLQEARELTAIFNASRQTAKQRR
ncbi:MAG TPA: four helix bundle protein [Candidatus Angelobacter sp.]|nr:four helix bundle protein [Candidatus Angelobacter sp.]